MKDTKSKLNPPTREEVWEIIRILKNNMSPRKDNISAEFIQCGEKKLWKEIHAMIGDGKKIKKMPENWRTAIICPMHKNGEKL